MEKTGQLFKMKIKFIKEAHFYRKIFAGGTFWGGKAIPYWDTCCKQKQSGLRGLLCRWPSITEWEMHITAQGPPSPILC